LKRNFRPPTREIINKEYETVPHELKINNNPRRNSHFGDKGHRELVLQEWS